MNDPRQVLSAWIMLATTIGVRERRGPTPQQGRKPTLTLMFSRGLLAWLVPASPEKFRFESCHRTNTQTQLIRNSQATAENRASPHSNVTGATLEARREAAQ